MTRKRGNPNWGKVGVVVPGQHVATEFETQTRQLGLQKHNYEASPQLRDWCEHNRNRCYIPEWLLDAWKMTVEDSYSGLTRARK